MYGPFALEMAKIHIEELHAEALRRRRRRVGPARWRRVAGRALIGGGARLGRVRVLTVQPNVGKVRT
jgi:hypothetical protein